MADQPQTAEDLVLAAISILQRGLPSGDLTDRDVISELWGIFDSPAAFEIWQRAHPGLANQSTDHPAP